MQGLLFKSFITPYKEVAKQNYGRDRSLGRQHSRHCLKIGNPCFPNPLRDQLRNSFE